MLLPCYHLTISKYVLYNCDVQRHLLINLLEVINIITECPSVHKYTKQTTFSFPSTCQCLSNTLSPKESLYAQYLHIAIELINPFCQCSHVNKFKLDSTHVCL